MATVVGVRFKNAGKLYYFDPGKLWPAAGCADIHRQITVHFITPFCFGIFIITRKKAES